LEYHSFDPFEVPDGMGRISYLGIVSYPTARFDGMWEISGGWCGVYGYYVEAFEEVMQYNSPCSLDVFFDYDSTKRFLKVKSVITAVNGFGNTRLYYAVAESHIYHPWEDLDSVHHVVRKMMPDHTGMLLPYIGSGETYLDSQSCTLDPEWNPRNCYVVAFVQRNYSGGWVLRSFKSSPWPGSSGMLMLMKKPMWRILFFW
jgi:hypothetical protein